MATFISEPVEPVDASFDVDVMARGEPSLPPSFRWRERVLCIAGVRKSWRSTKTDRGDVYLKRHWFECDLDEGGVAVLYFDRGARRGAPRWWLYTIDDQVSESGR